MDKDNCVKIKHWGRSSDSMIGDPIVLELMQNSMGIFSRGNTALSAVGVRDRKTYHSKIWRRLKPHSGPSPGGAISNALS